MNTELFLVNKMVVDFDNPHLHVLECQERFRALEHKQRRQCFNLIVRKCNPLTVVARMYELVPVCKKAEFARVAVQILLSFLEIPNEAYFICWTKLARAFKEHMRVDD